MAVALEMQADAARDAGAHRRRRNRPARIPADRASEEYLAALQRRAARRSTTRSIACANCWSPTGPPRSATALGRIERALRQEARRARGGDRAVQERRHRRRRRRCSTPASASARWTRSAPKSTAWSARTAAQLDDATSRWSADIAFARVGMQIDDRIHRRAAARRLAACAARRAAARRAPVAACRRTSSASKRSSRSARRTCRSSPITCRSCARTRSRSSPATSTTSSAASWSARRWTSRGWRSACKERDAESAAKLERTLQALDDGVQIKRRIIEELRPTLLDNLGLRAGARLAGARDLRPRGARVHAVDADRRHRASIRTCRSRSTGSCRKR